MIFVVAAAAVARHITFNPDINFWPFFSLEENKYKMHEKNNKFFDYDSIWWFSWCDCKLVIVVSVTDANRENPS